MNSKGSAANVVLITLGVIILIVLISVFSIAGTYNSLVNTDESVSNKWAKVQTAYERRADLIPNLVETVKGYSKHEGETQTKIAQFRSGIKEATNPSDINKVGNEMNSLISNLIVSVEAYPDLKASENFLALQDELAGTENRIKWERDNYNDEVKSYNIKVRSFPSNIIANIFGFERDKWDMFEAQEGSEDAPEISFE